MCRRFMKRFGLTQLISLIQLLENSVDMWFHSDCWISSMLNIKVLILYFTIGLNFKLISGPQYFCFTVSYRGFVENDVLSWDNAISSQSIRDALWETSCCRNAYEYRITHSLKKILDNILKYLKQNELCATVWFSFQICNSFLVRNKCLCVSHRGFLGDGTSTIIVPSLSTVLRKTF